MDDVADYARARWNDLVRTLVSLGAEPADAETLAARALARVWRAWGRERRDGDVDVLVYGALLTTSAAVGAPVDPERAAGVLTTGAALSAYQAEQVLGTAVDDLDHATTPLLGEEWDELYRGVAPVADIEAAVRSARRRTRLLVAGGLAAVVLVGGVVWQVQGSDPPAPPPPVPSPTSSPTTGAEADANPVGLAWWTDGTIHLARTTVAAPGLLSLAQAGVGTAYAVVWGDRQGTVRQVDADGTVSTLGHQTAGAPIAGSRGGLVSWVDPGDGGDPRLVVWSTVDHQEAGALTLDDAGFRPVAIDDTVTKDSTHVVINPTTGASTALDAVVYAVGPAPDPTSGLRWTVGERTALPAPPGLLDVAAGTELELGRPDARTLPAPFVVRDRHAALSRDGRYVARWRPGGSSLTVDTQPFSRDRPRPFGLPGGEAVLDARFTSAGSLVVVGVMYYRLGISSQDTESSVGRIPQTDLFTCDVLSSLCVRVAGRLSLGESSRALLLAH